MEYKVFIYIGLAAAYYGFKYWQKLRKNAETTTSPSIDKQKYPTTGPTFTTQTKIQDLLKEFGVDTYEQPESTQSFEQSETKIAYVQKETAQSYELPEIMAQEAANRKYQNVEGKSLIEYKSPKTDLKIEKEIDKFRFDVYREVEKKDSILKSIKTKKGLQRALIISEILKPKF